VVQEYEGRARFVAENYGASDLARRLGVKRYPALFVDDVLVATPKDFGFYGAGEGGGEGRYTPLRSAASHERLRADLTRMIDLVLAGRKDVVRAGAPKPDAAATLPALPALHITDLDGRVLDTSALRGRAVAIEMWATWCPPCRGTLQWLGALRKRHGDRLAVVTVAIESDSARVRDIARELALPLTWAMATPELVRALGDVTAVPTLLLFDPHGRPAGAWYGAAPGAHAEAEARLSEVLSAR
jgi:thiol-disulfide isomerase/thioredoxin